MTTQLDIRAHSANEAAAIVRELHPDAYIDSFDGQPVKGWKIADGGVYHIRLSDPGYGPDHQDTDEGDNPCDCYACNGTEVTQVQVPTYDVFVWATEADSVNDDGARAIARYRIVHA